MNTITVQRTTALLLSYRLSIAIYRCAYIRYRVGQRYVWHVRVMLVATLVTQVTQNVVCETLLFQ